MKKKNILLVVSVITGILFGIVIKVKIPIMSPHTSEKIVNQKRQLEVLEGQVKTNNEIIEDLEDKLDKININQNPKQLKNDLRQHISELKMIAGLENVVGDGIEIVLNDASSGYTWGTNLGVIHDLDIAIVLNDLRANGAEAISLNDIRIMENTYVECGGPIVIVGGISKGTPFVIKAIGDQDRLYASIYEKNSYISILEQVYHISVKANKRSDIIIPSRVR